MRLSAGAVCQQLVPRTYCNQHDKSIFQQILNALGINTYLSDVQVSMSLNTVQVIIQT